jgi:secondary thiamine-phosphate synthase enzyme
MKIRTTTLEIYPGPSFAVQNITHLINEFVESTSVQEGQLVVFYKHTTGSVIIGEHEVGVVADLERVLEMITPSDGEYLHHLREVDFNGYAHLRAAILPISLTIPILGGRLTLGTHQEVQVVDNQPEELPRFVVLQIIGE